MVCLAHDPPRFGPIIQDADIAKLGRDIGKNTHLQELQLSGFGGEHDIDKTHQPFQLLCEGINGNKFIKTLYVYNFNQLSGEIYQLLTLFLASNNNLQHINMEGGRLNREEMCLIASRLIRQNRPLELLNLRKNTIGDDLVQELAIASSKNPELIPKRLDLGQNGIGQDGCKYLSTLLQDQECSMKELIPSNCVNIDDNSAIILANVIVEDNTLEKMNILSGTSITSIGCDAFLKTLCNITTTDATYCSNHTLYDLVNLSWNYILLPIELRQYLIMNEERDKRTVACHKVFMNHFSDKINMQLFENITSDLLVALI